MKRRPVLILIPFFPVQLKKENSLNMLLSNSFHWSLFLSKVASGFIHKMILKVVSLSLGYSFKYFVEGTTQV